MVLLATWRGSIKEIQTGKMGEEELKDLGKVMGSGRRIARETSESVYICDSKRAGKTGTV